MKDPSQRTKVVVRHLPPSLSQDHLLSQIQPRFSGRYNWFSFRPGKSSQKHQKYSRAYIDFNKPEDVFEFAGFLNGHIFVNEKGSQFKAMVEYAPSQRIPKPCAKKDVREGTIYKDPDYLEFLKIIAKPADNLPSAGVQLERKEAEQSGSMVESPIITPLMEFVRQKRAAENGSQGSLGVRKLSKRVSTSGSKSGLNTTKRTSEKTKYILKGSSKKQSRKDKSSFVIASAQEDWPATSNGSEMAQHEKGITLTTNSGKKKILLLKSRERENAQGTSQLLGETSSGISPALGAPRQSQRWEAGGKLIRGILLSNEARQSQALKAEQLQKYQITDSDNVKQQARTVNVKSDSKVHSSHSEPSSLNSDDGSKGDDKSVRKDIKGFVSASVKQEKHPKYKGRPDHGVWALRHSFVSQASQEHPSSSVSQSNELLSPSAKGLQKHFSHHQMGKNNGSSIALEGKFSKRRGASGSVASEKQVWIQKSPSGS